MAKKSSSTLYKGAIMKTPAQKALYAVQLRYTSGHYAARRYAAKNGVLSLYRLACQLHAAEEAGL